MSLYIDTSCLLKLVLVEPESGRVHELVQAESQVLISTLAELEAEQQLWGRYLGGSMSRRKHQGLRGFLENFRGTAPFTHKTVPEDLARLALVQMRRSDAAYCRTLDRLHLAAMESLGVRRLLTHDDQQAAAARALGFAVVRPR
jgi:predicted nucleic acid-binding protein